MSIDENLIGGEIAGGPCGVECVGFFDALREDGVKVSERIGQWGQGFCAEAEADGDGAERVEGQGMVEACARALGGVGSG